MGKDMEDLIVVFLMRDKILLLRRRVLYAFSSFRTFRLCYSFSSGIKLKSSEKESEDG